MKLERQAGLFGSSGEIAFDAGFGRAARTELDARSWVEVVPGWLTGCDELFELLLREADWQQRQRVVFLQRFLEPRLTAEYRDFAEMPLPPLRAAAAALSTHYGTRYDSVWMNLYRDGRDGTGWHRDRFSCRRPECVVPVLSLGATRRFLIRPRNGGASVGFSARAGDLIVMGGPSATSRWSPRSPARPAGPPPRA